MAVDFSWLGYYMPIFGFFFVFVVMYAILIKTKILGDNAFTNAFVSFIFAIIFVTFSPGVDFVGTVLPWVSILIIALFFILLIVGFSQKSIDEFMKPGLAWVFIVILALIFLISAIVVFNPVIGPYLPGQPEAEASKFFGFIYGEKFLGALLLLVVAALASWVIARKGGGE